MRLLRDHLEKQEKRLDVEALQARILAKCNPVQVPDEPSKSLAVTRRCRRKWPAWVLGVATTAVAATLLLVLVLVPSAEVRAEQAVREAEAALQLPIERCYLVEVQRNGPELPEEPLPTRTVKVWTTGNRFCVEVTRGNFHWFWGRDQDGSVWLVSSPHRGLRIAPEEQGPALLWACDLYGLRPETVLQEILARCRLQEDRDEKPCYRRVIRAEPRRWARQHWLRFAVLELDAETKAIHKLSLTRMVEGKGTTTTTFTLIETRAADEARFRLEGHLRDLYQVYDREYNPAKRREILGRWVGPKIDHWLVAAPPK
jgi:hypothetical protein